MEHARWKVFLLHAGSHRYLCIEGRDRGEKRNPPDLLFLEKLPKIPTPPAHALRVGIFQRPVLCCISAGLIVVLSL